MNLSPVPPAWYGRAVAALGRVAVNNYPDATYTGLRDAIAEHTGFDPECVVLTGGADEAVQLCALLALRPGDEAYVRRPFYSWYGNATRLAGATLVHEPSRGRAAVVVVRAPQPDRRRRDRRRPARARRPRRDRPGVRRVRRARPLAARPRAPEHRGRPHLLEGVRARRRPDRLHPRAARDRPPARRDPAARLDLVVLGRARGDRASRGRRDARASRRDRGRARPHGGGAPRRRPRASQDSCANFLLVDLGEPAAAGLETAARPGPRGAHVRRPRSLRPTSASAPRRPPTTTSCWPRSARRAGARRGAGRGRGSAPPSAARPRPTSAAGSRSTAPAARPWPRGSACSTTC